MLPLLRRIHAGDPVSLRRSIERHMRSFNGHPYLCAMAVGALARLEQEAVSPEKMERFRTALRGPLGTLGDRVVWARWRPFCLLLAIMSFALGLGPVFSAGVFLILYNVGHVFLRAWAFHRGWRAGLQVGKELRDSWLDRYTVGLRPANMLLLGAVTVLLGRRALLQLDAQPIGWMVLAAAFVMAMFSFRWPTRGGRLAIGLLWSVPVVWFVVTRGIGM